MNEKAISTSTADQTREALVLSALRLFGQKGFDGTSTREVAAAANANIGSIAYHFGGKEGLRIAAADYIVATIQGIAGSVLGNIDQSLDTGMDREIALRQLAAAVERMVGFLVARPEAGEIVQFMLRELAHPTEALDRIYAGVFEPTHKRLCRIWEVATGEPAESPRTRITIFTLIGQVVYFRIAREPVMRRMGWSDIGPQESAQIVDVVKSNLDAILTARKGGQS
ncbi:CerR family C-terminal domain-containing protein [Mesorhizobium sp. LHD-90]|uniref:CerR family C-terminal domain-containing protein n=1 Tax=Mesorhizobium sp. LHD-90 TaxID=3071414 RepID=UPI0027DF544E|nr:CerR family C-terminal domain-containing protein [Mesorhizobium sp. LHD-90]MDQ6436237.1 CerR family C-terminal domain-containing protein [Mesorhizobium sp. LHD-90]